MSEQQEIKAWGADLRKTAAGIENDELRKVCDALASVTEQRELANLKVRQQGEQIATVLAMVARLDDHPPSQRFLHADAVRDALRVVS